MRNAREAAAAENARARPSGAGAAPDGRKAKPRAGDRRGEGRSGTGEFYGYLSQRLTAAPRLTAPNANDRQRGAESAALRSAFKESQAAATGHNSAEDSDPGLGAILDAIAAEVGFSAAMRRAGIMADFSARMSYARRHAPRHQVASMLAALRKQRKAALAALAVLAEQTGLELKGRQRAALAARKRVPRGPHPS